MGEHSETSYDVFIDIPNHADAFVMLNDARHPLAYELETYVRHPFVLKVDSTLEVCTKNVKPTTNLRAVLHLPNETHAHFNLKATPTGLHVHVRNDSESVVEESDIALNQPFTINIPQYGEILVHCERHEMSVLEALLAEQSTIAKSEWDVPEDYDIPQPEEETLIELDPIDDLQAGDNLTGGDLIKELLKPIVDLTVQNEQDIENYLESIKSSMRVVNVLDGQKRDYVTPCKNLARSNTSLKMYHDSRTIGPESDTHGKGAYYDIYNSINNAEKHVFISGWSLNVDMRLNKDVDETLGNLLKKKANQGVTVCVLLWRATPESKFNFTQGLEDWLDFGSTRNYAAYRFFEDSKVQLKLWGADLTPDVFSIFAKTMHQKFIICDTKTNGVQDSIAYIGGLDLTYGRYDTPDHPLFPEEDSHYLKYSKGDKVDNDQNNYYGGVRLPWHDIHMAVTGEIVKDLTKHFSDRWTHVLFAKTWYLKKTSSLKANKEAKMHENVNLNNLVQVASVPRGPYVSQLLLSFGESEKTAEKSIQTAYLTNIALAKQFIYIESQYLIGGSRAWEHPNDFGNNQVPLQIIFRIEEAIRYRQQFKVYIVIPLFSDNQQYMTRVMHNQFETISMMYKAIGRMIKQYRSNDPHAPKPDDYLFIGCLGKSEVNKKDNKAEHNQIYVHSKMMIIDDQLMIAGSANLNERSMNGAMDAEICISLWDAKHTVQVSQAEERHDAELGTEPQEEKVKQVEKDVAENESIKSFRTRVWKEVFGEEIAQMDPHSSKCMEFVKELANKNRVHFLKKRELEKGHIMRAPFTVDSNGVARPEKVGINYINKVSGQEYLNDLDFSGSKAKVFSLLYL